MTDPAASVAPIPARLTKGEQTRERILAIAESRVLRFGFAGTSIEDVIAEAGLSRSAFFYHFPDKHHLAIALLERYLTHDDAIFNELLGRADALIDDPLHAFMAFLKMFSEVTADLPARHPGCLVASYCYQEQIYSSEIRRMSVESMMGWRRRFRLRLDAIAERYPPRFDVDLDTIADLLITLVEGGIIIDKANDGDPVLPRQVLMARNVVRQVFQPT